MEESNNRVVIKEVDPGFKTGIKSRLCIYKQPNNLYALYFKDGGNLPESLTGSYTSVVDADRCAMTYLFSKFEISAAKVKHAERMKNTAVIKKTVAKKKVKEAESK